MYDVIITSLCDVVAADYEGVVKLSEDFNGADLRNVCTEAGQNISSSSPISPAIIPKDPALTISLSPSLQGCLQ